MAQHQRDMQKLKKLHKLGVKWKYGQVLPTYRAKMTPKQVRQADKIYDDMSDAFVDWMGRRRERKIKPFDHSQIIISK